MLILLVPQLVERLLLKRITPKTIPLSSLSTFKLWIASFVVENESVDSKQTLILDWIDYSSERLYVNMHIIS